MNTDSNFFQTFKPGIPKRYLLLVAACFWTFAGGMLLVRGFSILKFEYHWHLQYSRRSAGTIFQYEWNTEYSRRAAGTFFKYWREFQYSLWG